MSVPTNRKPSKSDTNWSKKGPKGTRYNDKRTKYQKKNWNEKRSTLALKMRKESAAQELEMKTLAEQKKRQLAARNAYLMSSVLDRSTALRNWLVRGRPVIIKKYSRLKNKRASTQAALVRPKLLVSWLRKYRLRRLLRQQGGGISIRNTEAKQQYFVRLPYAITYKFGAYARYPKFRYSAQRFLRRPRPVWKPYAVTLRGLWNFFENYRKYTCRRLTDQWRKAQLLRLASWVRASIRLSESRRFFISDTIYRVLNRVSNWSHPDELRAQRAQAAIVKLSKQSNTPAGRSLHWFRYKTLALLALAIRKIRKARLTEDKAVNWSDLKKQLGVLFQQNEAVALKKPRPPVKPMTRPVAAWQRVRYIAKMRHFYKKTGAYARAHKRYKERLAFASILWRFISPTWKSRHDGFPPVTKTGLKPTTKQLVPYLKRRNWLNFTTRPLRRDYRKRYGEWRWEMSKAYIQRRFSLVKRTWADEYREKTPTRIGYYKAKKRRYPRYRRGRGVIKTVRATLISGTTVRPALALSFGSPRYFSTYQKGPSFSQPTTKERMNKKELESYRPYKATHDRKNRDRKDQNFQKKQNRYSPSSAPYWGKPGKTSFWPEETTSRGGAPEESAKTTHGRAALLSSVITPTSIRNQKSVSLKNLNVKSAKSRALLLKCLLAAISEASSARRAAVIAPRLQPQRSSRVAARFPKRVVPATKRTRTLLVKPGAKARRKDLIARRVRTVLKLNRASKPYRHSKRLTVTDLRTLLNCEWKALLPGENSPSLNDAVEYLKTCYAAAKTPAKMKKAATRKYRFYRKGGKMKRRRVSFRAPVVKKRRRKNKTRLVSKERKRLLRVVKQRNQLEGFSKARGRRMNLTLSRKRRTRQQLKPYCSALAKLNLSRNKLATHRKSPSMAVRLACRVALDKAAKARKSKKGHFSRNNLLRLLSKLSTWGKRRHNPTVAKKTNRRPVKAKAKLKPLLWSQPARRFFKQPPALRLSRKQYPSIKQLHRSRAVVNPWASVEEVTFQKKKPVNKRWKRWKRRRALKRRRHVAFRLHRGRRIVQRRPSSWEVRETVLALEERSGLRRRGRRIKASHRWVRRRQRNRLRKYQRLGTKTMFARTPLLSTNSGGYDRTTRGLWLARRRVRKLNRRQVVVQLNHRVKQTNRTLAQRLLNLQLQSQTTKYTKRVGARAAARALGSGLASVPTFYGFNRDSFGALKARVRRFRTEKSRLNVRAAQILSPFSARLIAREAKVFKRSQRAVQQKATRVHAFLNAVSTLSGFDKQKRALVLRVTRNQVRGRKSKLQPRKRLAFSRRRRRALLKIKRPGKRAIRKEWGQRRAYKKVIKKKVWPRGRNWWRGFKRRPTRRKRRLVFLTAAKRPRVLKQHRSNRLRSLSLHARGRRNLRQRLRFVKLNRFKARIVTARHLKRWALKMRQLRRVVPNKGPVKARMVNFLKNRSLFKNLMLEKLRAPTNMDEKFASVRSTTAFLSNRFWQKYRREEVKKQMLPLPYFVPQYRLRARLLKSGAIRRLSREEQTAEKNKNIDRHIAALNLQRSRRKKAKRWNKALPIFKWPSSVQYEEKVKRDIHRKRWEPAGAHAIAARSGYPATAGISRARHTFISKFNKFRRQPTPLELPHKQPTSLQPTVANTKAPTKMIKLFRHGRVKLITGKALAERSKRHNLNSKSGISTASAYGASTGKKFLDSSYRHDRNWEVLGRWFQQDTSALLNTPKTSKRAAALTALLEKDRPAWAAYNSKYSHTTVATLKSHFVAGSRRWLSERPFERLISAWSLSMWARFKTFIEGQNSQVPTKGQSVVAFRAAFIKSARIELLKQQPSWWEDEARLRAAFFLRGVIDKHAPEDVLLSYKTQNNARAFFDVQAGLGRQEKKAFAFLSLHHAANGGAVLYGENANPYTNHLTDKDVSSMYHRWLTSIEAHLKKSRTARSSQDYNDLRGNYITEVGTEQPRFPGAGRQKKTFDAVLRRHYSKVMPLRRRRLKRLVLKKVRSPAIVTFMSRATRFESSSKLRWAQKRAKTVAPFSYFTPRRRRLANRMLRQHKKGRAQAETSKNHFTALPLRLLKAIKDSTARRFRSKEITNFSGLTEALVQAALRKRFVTRRIRDLRKSVTRRKIWQYKAIPFWIQRKWERRSQQAARISRYYLDKFYGRAGAKSKNWIFSEFALRVPKNRVRLPKIATPSGEILENPRKIKRKDVLTFLRNRQLSKVGRVKRRRVNYYTNIKIKPTRKYKYKVRTTRFKGYRRPVKHTSLKIEEKLLRRLDKAQLSTSYKFIKQTQPTTLLSPLHFLRPTTRISATAEDKERWRLHVQATRLRKYRRLTEVSEALTSLFPHLISLFLSKRMRGQPVTPKVAAGWVRGIYWSLRMYLNYDLTGTKAVRFNTNLAKRRLLKKELTTLADDRYFDLSSLRGARYRFQPHRLHYAGPLRRGALEWLRHYLPNFYELYLEDPEKYKHLTLTPVKVFRSQLSAYATRDWGTKNVKSTMEQQYNRLTTNRFSANSTRFENMLMTVRRPPVLGGSGAAATLRVISPVGSSTARSSFFRRQFSTHARPREMTPDYQTLDGLSSRLELLRRHSTTETEAISQSVAVSARSKRKPALIAAARVHSMGGGRDAGPGSLDLRTIRAKSPRNADYIKRLPAKSQSRDLGLTLLPYHDFLQSAEVTGEVNQEAVFRDTRAVRAVSILNSSDETLTLQRNWSSSLQKYRGEISKRRAPALLTSRLNSAERVFPLKSTASTRLYLKKERAQKRLLRFRLKYTKADPLDVAPAPKVIKSSRSILNFRKAGRRNIKQLYRSVPAILTRVIQLRRRLWNSLRLNNYSGVIRNKYKKQLPKNKVYLRFISKSGPKKSESTFTRKIKAAARSVVTGWEVSTVKRIFFSPERSGQSPFLVSNKKLIAKRATKARSVNSNFIQHARAVHSNLALLSKYANRLERVRSREMSSERRPELWNMLTQRWNKKFRYLKKWLRDISYSFKQHYWSYEGTHILPDELFKLARIRLRKLTWRESDELFYRDGLKHAFTFHPRERLNTRWLEPLLLRRSLYNCRRGEYRRYQFPREQKNRKWLQKLRKLMFRTRLSRAYIKGRRWPLLRMYSQRLHRSAFHIRNSKAVLKRFRKAARRRTIKTGLEKMMVGFGDRLDVNLLLLNIAPTVFWARILATMGLLRVNGKVIRKASFRLRPGDFVEWMWEEIQRVRISFNTPFKRFNRTNILQQTSLQFPGNFEYHPKLRGAWYKRLPAPGDLPESGRVNECLFNWFRLDGGLGRK